jgi:DNA-binding HxlR family transcriptional regulator
MNASQALETGTLPGIWTEADARERRKTLQTYAATYLKEEIQAEALTRNIEGFSRFLFVVAAEAGKFLDLSKLAGAAGIPRQSALRFFEILEAVPGLHDRLLSERLKELEAEGIVKRRVYPETPVRIEYELTAKGRDLERVVTEVQQWANRWLPVPARARR